MSVATPSAVRVEPYLHVEPEHVYNPLTDRCLRPGDDGYAAVRAAALDSGVLPPVSAEVERTLSADGWLVETTSAESLSRRFYLKYVSLEAHTVCNQGCYFCPVSTHRREDYFMPLDFYREVVGQLAAHRDTIEGVSMINYNEPTVDHRFVEQVAILHEHRLPPAVLTNATGLTPRRVDAIAALGGLHYLSVNLSTLDSARYAADREGDHLRIVLRNLDHVVGLERPLAKTMEVAVLGQGDERHRADFEAIARRFEGTAFDVKFYEVMDRAGNVPIGLRPGEPLPKLCGCEQTGSRPLQWVHITPRGKCLLCCQDYHERHVVGDLHRQSLDEILSGPAMALLRRWVYGIEEAPADFLCRNCIYARTR